LSTLHIGGGPLRAAPQVASEPRAPRSVEPPRVEPKVELPVAPIPVPEPSASLRAASPVERPVEKRIVSAPPPPIETIPTPEPVRTRPESSMLPEPPPPLPPRDVSSPLREELPPSGRRPLSSPRVFSPAAPLTPRPEPPPPPQPEPIPAAHAVGEPPRISRQPVVETEVFGSLTEVQRRQSRSARVTLLMLLVAVIIIFVIGWEKVPVFHDAIVGAFDLVSGKAAREEKIAESPKIEAVQKVALAGPTLFIDGKVRNIDQGGQPLENIYAEVSVSLANGKLAETRLIPIYEGNAPSKPGAPDEKANRTIGPSQEGYYKMELPGAMYHDAQL